MTHFSCGPLSQTALAWRCSHYLRGIYRRRPFNLEVKLGASLGDIFVVTWPLMFSSFGVCFAFGEYWRWNLKLCIFHFWKEPGPRTITMSRVSSWRCVCPIIIEIGCAGDRVVIKIHPEALIRLDWALRRHCLNIDWTLSRH